MTEIENAENEKRKELIQNKIVKIANSDEYKETKRAQTFAIINAMVAEGKLNSKEIYKKPLNELNGFIKQTADSIKSGTIKLSSTEIKKLYTQYKKNLDENSASIIGQDIAQCINNFGKVSSNRLVKLLKNHGNYMIILADKNGNADLKRMLLKIIISDFDKEFNTEYSAQISEISDSYIKKQEMESKLEVLEEVDLEGLFGNIW